MKIALEVYSQDKLLRHDSLGDGSHSLGSAGCDVTLAYPTVSRLHGAIAVGPEGVTYVDRSSRNGSFLAADGAAEPVEPERETLWPARKELLIGPFVLRWREHPGESEPVEELHRLAAQYARWLAEIPAAARERLCDALEGNPRRDELLERVHREYHGHGPLHRWIDDPDCREILVNAHDEIFIDRGEGPGPVTDSFLSRETFEAWATRTAHAAGRRLDLHHPICEATLENGARFHAVLPPVSARGLSIAIRRFGSAPLDERAALATGWVTGEALRLLRQAVVDKRNIVISGGTSTGKTSLLNFLCRYLPPDERVVTVEDTVELTPPVRNLVQLQARTANADGVGEVSLRQLVQCALRMRPDRIIVGECRGAEVLEMLQALNTGHPGSLTTVHANSTDEALQRLELLALLGAANLSLDCIRRWIESSVDLVVQVRRGSSGRRRVAQIAARRAEGGGFEQVFGLHEDDR